MEEEKEYKEEFKLNGGDLLVKVRELIKEGKARKIIINNENGETLIEVPLHVGAAVGAAGLILAPALAAIGAIAALVTNCTVIVIKNNKV